MVDPTNPSDVYAATGAGLFRSTDAGASYVNVKLPTGECAGKSNRAPGCLFANIVTDVVVQQPGGIATSRGGIVVAAVGWRGGNADEPRRHPSSPRTTASTSPTTGAPGSFTKVNTVGFAPQDGIGRVELGAATGPHQDHDYLYAIVQDARHLRQRAPGDRRARDRGCSLALPDRPERHLRVVATSARRGRRWPTRTSCRNPTTGSALAGVGAALGGFGPGVQAWYNMFIVPDPTRQTRCSGVPTRLCFGLEEVWQNELTVSRRTARPVQGDRPLLQRRDVPVPRPRHCRACPTDRERRARGDDHDAPRPARGVFIPRGGGGVKLVVGNDGGVYTQTVGAGEEFTEQQLGRAAPTTASTRCCRTTRRSPTTARCGWASRTTASAKIQTRPTTTGRSSRSDRS